MPPPSHFSFYPEDAVPLSIAWRWSCALMAGEEGQTATGSLCHLCWDGPPAPKEAFCQLPLVLSKLPREASRRKKPKCMLSVLLHWLRGTATNCSERWLVFWKPSQGPWIFLQYPSDNGTSSSVVLAHRCAHFNSQCHVCEFPPIFSGLWQVLE